MYIIWLRLDWDHNGEHTYTHLLVIPNEASAGMRAGADLRNPSLVNGCCRMSWVARYCCSSLAVTKPDLTPSRLRAIKSLSASRFLVDIVWVCQLEIAIKWKREKSQQKKYHEIKKHFVQHTKLLWWEGLHNKFF